MTLEDKTHFEDLLIKAVQSGKKETSGLVDLIIHKQEPAIKQAIKEHVNGQFDRFKEEFRIYVVKDTQDKEKIFKWQSEADPYIKGLANITGSGKIIVWIAIAITTIISAILAIKKYLL